jgi:hypothetical protein
VHGVAERRNQSRDSLELLTLRAEITGAEAHDDVPRAGGRVARPPAAGAQRAAPGRRVRTRLSGKLPRRPGTGPGAHRNRHILGGHLPYPALVVDRHGDVVAANQALDLLTEGANPALIGPGTNAYRLALHPDGMAPHVLNFAEWARHILERTRHLGDLHAELTQYVPELEPPAGHLGFSVPLRLRTSRGELRLITTVTTFATAVDVTLAELKLEAFLSADQPTAEALQLAGAPARQPLPP